MSNYRTTLTAILKAVGLSLLLYLLLQMLLALLAVKGTLPENRLLAAQAVSMGLCLLPGGLYAARKAGLGSLPSALLTGLCLCAVLALLGLLAFDGPCWSASTGLLLLGGAGGSVLAGLLGGRRKKRRTRSRRLS